MSRCHFKRGGRGSTKYHDASRVTGDGSLQGGGDRKPSEPTFPIRTPHLPSLLVLQELRILQVSGDLPTSIQTQTPDQPFLSMSK